jgi:hypothetical protein
MQQPISTWVDTVLSVLLTLVEDERYEVANAAIAAWCLRSFITSIPLSPSDEAVMQAFDPFAEVPLVNNPPHINDYAKQLLALPEAQFKEALRQIAPQIDLQEALNLDDIDIDQSVVEEAEGRQQAVVNFPDFGGAWQGDIAQTPVTLTITMINSCIGGIGSCSLQYTHDGVDHREQGRIVIQCNGDDHVIRLTFEHEDKGITPINEMTLALSDDRKVLDGQYRGFEFITGQKNPSKCRVHLRKVDVKTLTRDSETIPLNLHGICYSFIDG